MAPSVAYETLDTGQFSACFSRRVADLANITEGEVTAIDGKCLRRSIDKYSYKINLVFSAEILKDILKGISERFKTGISFPG